MMDSVGVKKDTQEALICYFDLLSKLPHTDLPNYEALKGCFPKVNK